MILTQYYKWLTVEMQRIKEETKEGEKVRPPTGKYCETILCAFIRWERQLDVMLKEFSKYKVRGGTLTDPPFLDKLDDFFEDVRSMNACVTFPKETEKNPSMFVEEPFVKVRQIQIHTAV